MGAGCCFFIFGHQSERADALVVHTEVFGIRAGNQQFFIVFQEYAQAVGIFFQAVAEALVGKVKQWQPAFFGRKFSQSFPLFGRRVDAGRVVAAAVQQDDVALLRLAQVFNHAVPIQTVFGGIVITIWFVLDTDCFGDGVVVWPSRIGNPDGLRVQLTFDKLGRNTQCACTAKALRCFGATAGNDFVVFAKQQDLGLLVVIGNAVDGQVVFGCFAFQQAFFSLFDGFDNRRRAGCIFVHADAEIDFFGTGFSFKRFAQT